MIKLSEYIKMLQEIEAQGHGDLPVARQEEGLLALLEEDDKPEARLVRSWEWWSWTPPKVDMDVVSLW